MRNTIQHGVPLPRADAAPAHSRPIGVFDSGVGGLSVLKEIRAALPHEHVVYVADSAHAPYGDKSYRYVEERALALGRFLLGRGVKAIVIASNTGTAGGAAALRAALSIPVVAMEPAVKPAAGATRSGVVGVLATVGTTGSTRFADLLARVDSSIEVIATPAPGLVEHIERGEIWGPEARALVQQYVQPMLDRGADTIVLGSTHYVFLRRLITEVAGPHVTLIDTGEAVARQVQRVLFQGELLNPHETEGWEEFWTSSTHPGVKRVIEQLYGAPIEVRALPSEYA